METSSEKSVLVFEQRLSQDEIRELMDPFSSKTRIRRENVPLFDKYFLQGFEVEIALHCTLWLHSLQT